MTPSDAPKLVYSLVSTSMIVAILQLPFSILLVAWGQPLGFLATTVALLLTLHTIRSLSTRLTDDEVSQFTWVGRVHLSWAEITHMKKTSQSFILSGDKRRVVVPVEFFENTAAAIHYIEAHLPSHLSGE